MIQNVDWARSFRNFFLILDMNTQVLAGAILYYHNKKKVEGMEAEFKEWATHVRMQLLDNRVQVAFADAGE